MKIIQEFKEFAVRGNVVDMAVGIIIGAAFGKIVSSLVADIVMPPLGVIIGGVNFTGLKIILKEAEGALPAVTLNYGTFFQTVFDFVIVAFSIFMAIKVINRIRRTTPPEPAKPSTQEVLLAEIRDLLKQKNI